MKNHDFFELRTSKTSAGQIIKAFRKNFKITQLELSQITGIAEANLSAIENNKIEIGVKRAVLIATALGIDPSQLLFPNGIEDAYPKEIKRIQKNSAKVMRKKTG